jgi:ribosomal protein S18 acetylase RimI-like enzyme
VRRHRELIWSRVDRRRATREDWPFLEEAHLAALGPVALVGYGWTKERLRAQFHREVALANCEVIVVDDRDAGYISTENRGRWWYVDAFAILPNFQNAGVGAAALQTLLEDACRVPVPVRLSVLRTNPARALYLRLGFRVIGGDRSRERMEWRATSS